MQTYMIIGIVIFMIYFMFFRGKAELPPEEAQRLIKEESAVMIDVRSEGEFSGGSVPNAVNIPLGSLGSVKKTVPNKQTPILVFCLSGSRAGQAKKSLVNMGYSKVFNMGSKGSMAKALKA